MSIVPAVSVWDLRHRFGEHVAVDGVDLSVRRGEVFGLLGPNGAGKTTTIRVLNTLLPLQEGTVEIFGCNVGREQMTVRRTLGYVPQQLSIESALTGRQNVSWFARLYDVPRRERKERVAEALDTMGLTEAADRLAGTYSGGMVRRLELAQALVNRPALLVLDEPTVAMDVEGRHAFWDSMRGFAARGKTIVFATHYLEEADANADRAVLMAHGTIVADGPTTEIKAMVGVRTIRATLPGVDIALLEALPGVTSAERRGEAIMLHCADSDAAIRALLAAYPAVRDIEIAGAGLEQAFLQLTGGEDGA
jgi:ABC-2 type transport system ATP-binding protein